MPEQSELPQQQGKQGKFIINNRKEETTMIYKRLNLNERPIFPKRAIITAGMPYGNKMYLKKITENTSEFDVFDESSKLFTLKDWTSKAIPMSKAFAVLNV